jgi:hypothetical protein
MATIEEFGSTDELMEALHKIIPGAELQVDDETGEISFTTNLAEDEDGTIFKTDEVEDDFDDEDDED